ncbi:MAG TPA: hypothetical protein VFL83_14620 [Anaeromyxobacter sp.]|nr:hypothetical protein [Anaeromyxobacter sp.]
MARLVRRELELARATLRGWGSLVARAWRLRPPGPRLAAIAFACGAGIVGAAAIAAQTRLPSRLPSARDWDAVRTLVARDARPGDAVLLSPPWAERAREVLPATAPVLSRARWSGEDLLGVRRVWLISIPRSPGFSWDLELDLLERASRSAPAESVGAFEVALLDLAYPIVPLAFLPDRLAGAHATLGGVPCAEDPAGGFRCDAAAAGTARVARDVREIAGAARPCIAATFPGGAPLELGFPPVRVGRVVRGHVGGVLGAATAAPVRVAVVLDGEEAGAAEISGAGWLPFQIDTTRFAGQPREVSLVLTTPAASAALCLEAATLP